MAERFLGKEEVVGPIPTSGSMKNGLLGFAIGLIISLLTLGGWYFFLQSPSVVTPVGKLASREEKPKPLLSYTFEALKKRQFDSHLTFTKVVKSNPEFTTWDFSFEADGRRVLGIANIPSSESQLATISGFTTPIIILNRGFASQQEFYPGFGTERVASVLAQTGYVTLAPNHLGFGGSDNPSTNVFEERFQTYTTVLSLLSGADKLCQKGCRLGMWGHSNGGHISLAALAITGRDIPTVLWNPVTKPFPYSILFYTDDFDDHGKALRRVLAQFEDNYNVEEFTVTNYLSWIKAPILLQQGEIDELVPRCWSDEFTAAVKKEATLSALTYKVYPQADHNLVPSWDKAVADMLNFYQSLLAK